MSSAIVAGILLCMLGLAGIQFLGARRHIRAGRLLASVIKDLEQHRLPPPAAASGTEHPT